jgi:putative transposase
MMPQEVLMHGPKPPVVTLSAAERGELERLVRGHTTPQQVARRAQIILAAAAGESNVQIARTVGMAVAGVRRWRQRWLSFSELSLDDLGVADRLADAPRPGTPARIGAEQVCAIVALACEAPATSGRPISQWTGREVADEIMRRGIVESISPRHAARVLKRGRSNPTWCATG